MKANKLKFRAKLSGLSGVGKTSLFNRIKYNQFTSTSYVNDLAVVWNYESFKIQLVISDTMGYENYTSLTSGFYTDIHIVLLVFDLNDRRSFDDLNEIYSDIQNFVDQTVKIVLIGNKSDLESQINTIDGINMSEKLHSKFYIKTSAYNGNGIEDLIKELQKLIENEFIPQSQVPKQNHFCPKFCNFL